MIFQWFQAEMVWKAVSEYKKYFDVYSALDELESLTIASRGGTPVQLRVIGFPNLNLSRPCVREVDLIEQDGVYIWRYGGMDTPSPLVPAPMQPGRRQNPSPIRGRQAIFYHDGNGQVNIKRTLTKWGFPVVDKRPKKGCLWVVGNSAELEDLVIAIMQSENVQFRFTPHGGKATGHKAGWYMK